MSSVSLGASGLGSASFSPGQGGPGAGSTGNGSGPGANNGNGNGDNNGHNNGSGNNSDWINAAFQNPFNPFNAAGLPSPNIQGPAGGVAGAVSKGKGKGK